MITKWANKLGMNQFLDLIYPNLCLSCDTELIQSEENICLECSSSLQKYDLKIANQKYIGTFIPHNFIAICQYNKHSSIQKLLHKLKYQNEPEIGVLLGEQIAKLHPFKEIDCIIPMPIHKKKLKKRGYNQALKIAEGINNITHFPIYNNTLVKTKNTIPQARKNKKERLEIDYNLFKVQHPETIVNQHILIVDDVITTGATLETAIGPLLKIEGIKISVAVIAFT